MLVFIAAADVAHLGLLFSRFLARHPSVNALSLLRGTGRIITQARRPLSETWTCHA